MGDFTDKLNFLKSNFWFYLNFKMSLNFENLKFKSSQHKKQFEDRKHQYPC